MFDEEKRKEIREKENYLRQRESLNRRIRYQKEEKKIGRIKRIRVLFKKIGTKSWKSTKNYLIKWTEPSAVVGLCLVLTGLY